MIPDNLRGRVNVSLAAFPGKSFHEAMALAASGVSEPLVGPLQIAETQLCPQNRGIVSLDYAEALKNTYPDTRFRLHANVRVLPDRWVLDLADFDRQPEYWRALSRVNAILSAPVYTAHAGKRSSTTLHKVLENAQRCADLFGVPVGIEGHYPTRSNAYLISTWEEYAQLLSSAAHFAVDLSHLAILAHLTGRREDGLVKEMLSSDRCLEVHLSANDGMHDEHKTLSGDWPWWWSMLVNINRTATVFSEGVQR